MKIFCITVLLRDKKTKHFKNNGCLPNVRKVLSKVTLKSVHVCNFLCSKIVKFHLKQAK